MSKADYILAVNAGSSSLKFSLYSSAEKECLLQGSIEGIGRERGALSLSKGGEKEYHEVHCEDHKQAWQEASSALAGYSLNYFVHRIVHGGRTFIYPIFIDKLAEGKLRKYLSFAPTHLSYELALIKAIEKSHKNAKQFACFDTAFHANLPMDSKVLSLPYSFYEKGIQKYGFHGLSYEYIASQIDFSTYPKAVVAHLGNGASCAAIEMGKGIDTTMGFSPTGGLVMGTRSGDLDPGAIIYLLREKVIKSEELDTILNHQSGLLGISEISGDMQKLLESEDPKAKLAIEIFTKRAAQFITSMMVSLQGMDLLVFTGGIGENAPLIREKIVEKLQILGITLDKEKNEKSKKMISQDNSPINVQVIPTNENQIMVKHAIDLIDSKAH